MLQTFRPLRSLRRRNAEQANLGRGVEAEAEQQADEVHVPAAGHQPEQAAEQAAEEAAPGEQQVEVFVVIAPAGLYAPEGLKDRDQHHHVHQRDGEQEGGGDNGADDAAEILQGQKLCLDGKGGDRHHRRQRHHDAGMAEREEQADADRALTLLHQLAGDIVDGGDVVGIDGVAQTEAIGQKGGAEQHRVVVEADHRRQPSQHIGGDENAINAERSCHACRGYRR